MKREILFKAKRIDNGEWVEGTYTKIAYDCDFADVIIPDVLEKHDMGFDSSTYAIIDPNTLSQFTGLLDKNGDKIFEGDISELCTKGPIFVYFHNEHAVFYCATVEHFRQNIHEDEDNLWPLDYPVRDNCFEIIGNIHDKEKSSE